MNVINLFRRKKGVVCENFSPEAQQALVNFMKALKDKDKVLKPNHRYHFQMTIEMESERMATLDNIRLNQL